MAEVFITGGTGYLGRRLIPRLAARGHAGRALSAGLVASPPAHPSGAKVAVKWRSAFGWSTMRTPRRPSRRSWTSRIASTT